VKIGGEAEEKTTRAKPVEMIALPRSVPSLNEQFFNVICESKIPLLFQTTSNSVEIF